MIPRAQNIPSIRVAAGGVRLLVLVWLLASPPAWGANMASDYLPTYTLEEGRIYIQEDH